MKTLILMRHAEAGPGGKGEPDRARRLTADGLATAIAAGRYLDGAGYLPDLALVSDARRTRETLDGLSPAMRVQPETVYDLALYGADGEGLLEHVRAHGGSAHCLLVIGHNPAIGDLARILGRDGVAEERARLARGFPSGAFAVLAFDSHDWTLLDADRAKLEHFVTPAMLPAHGPES